MLQASSRDHIEGKENEMALFNHHIKLVLSDWAEKLGSRWANAWTESPKPRIERDIRAVGEGAVEAALFN